MRGKKGEVNQLVVFITAGIEKPLEIKPVGFNLDGRLNYTVETVEEGKKYKVTFRNNPEINSDLRGALTFTTNYEEKPRVAIRIQTRFR